MRIFRGKVWSLRQGDLRLRVQPDDLAPADLFVEIGSFDGTTVQRFASRNDIRIVAFEPLPEYIGILQKKFGSAKNIVVEQKAVGATSGDRQISANGEASSEYSTSHNVVTVSCVDISEWMGDEEIACLSINAEGAEFEILERLLETEKIRHIRLLEVQFHRVICDAAARRQRIRQQLQRYMLPVHCTPWVWEVWKSR